MDNQHRKITGYRELTAEEIALMNKCKSQGAELQQLMSDLKALPEIDKDWLHEAEMTLKKGIMYAVRSIAKPESF